MLTNGKIDPDVDGKPASIKVYRGIIGSFLYLTANRPDISFAVGIYAHFQADPKESHLEATKKILRYVKGAANYDMWYPCDDNLELIGYSDSDYGGCKLD